MKKILLLWSFTMTAAALCVFVGCEKPQEVKSFDYPVDLGTTISSLGTLYKFKPVTVKGFGLVAGLSGTGSGECPPALRNELIKFITKQIPSGTPLNASRFIDSKNTAVVEINGVIPAIAMKGDNFDLHIRAIDDTQTTSLAGGRLYTTELKEADLYTNFVSYLTTLGTAMGPVYVDQLSDSGGADSRQGYILGGGTVSKSVNITIALYEPNYFTANAIRNKLNERFGPRTARAISPSEIKIEIPDKFNGNREKFLEMVGLVFLPGPNMSQQDRVAILVDRLVSDDNKLRSELSLEAIGKSASEALAKLLVHEDEKIRFHAARCMLNVDDNRGLEVLRKFAYDPGSSLRIESIKAIGIGAERSVASLALTGLLDDEDFKVRYACYEQLRRLEDVSVSRTLVAGDFFIERVLGGGSKTVYISQKGSPRIVIFGYPVKCEADVFVNSPNGNLTISGRKENDYVSLLRKHPGVARPAGPIKTSRDISEIVRTFCERMDVGDKSPVRQGLGASYADVASLLKKMCQAGAIKAEFVAGQMTDVKRPE